MKYIKIDKTLKKAIYRQIEDSIIEAIQNHQLKDGDQLPTEHELSVFYLISVVIIRKAYDNLQNKGLIQKIQGKGTFVHLLKKITLPLMHIFEIEKYLLLTHRLEEHVLLLSLPLKNQNDRDCVVKSLVYVDHKPLYFKVYTLEEKLCLNLQHNLSLAYSTDKLVHYLNSHSNIHKTTLKAYLGDSSIGKLFDFSIPNPFYCLTNQIKMKESDFLMKINVYFPNQFVEFEVNI